jgi:hypothetical protein
MHDPRTHLYRFIHKAVRARLGQLSALAFRTDFGDPAELRALRARVRGDFVLLGKHAGHEDEFIMPLLEAHAPSVAQRLELAHHEQHEDMPALEAQLASIEATHPEVGERGAAFCIALSRYIADQLQHMADEETLAMPALYAALDDERLIALHDELVGSMPPEETMQWLQIMLPSLSAPERAGVLFGMRQSAPAEAFEAVLELARQVLSLGNYEDLMRRLEPSTGRAA